MVTRVRKNQVSELTCDCLHELVGVGSSQFIDKTLNVEVTTFRSC